MTNGRQRGAQGRRRPRHSRHQPPWKRFVGLVYYRHPWILVMVGGVLLTGAVAIIVNDLLK